MDYNYSLHLHNENMADDVNENGYAIVWLLPELQQLLSFSGHPEILRPNDTQGNFSPTNDVYKHGGSILRHLPGSGMVDGRKWNLTLIFHPRDATSGLIQSKKYGWILRMEWLTTQKGGSGF